MLPVIIAILLLTTPVFAQDTYQLQVKTSDMTSVGVEYNDAQYYTCPENMTLATCKDYLHDEIVTEKAKRIANFEDAIKNPPAPVEITKEQYLEAKAQLEAQVAEVNAKIVEIDAKPKDVIAEEAIIG
jgi:hypothetical protein